jgi:hypothetical protein
VDVIKLNNFKGTFLFNENNIEDLEEMNEIFSTILTKEKFLLKKKNEVLEQIKSSESSENDIGLFL